MDIAGFTTITKALSDPHRVRALMALRGGELCACQIIELLHLAPSTVSKHMMVLKQAGLVKSRKEERWIYYRLPQGSELTGDLEQALAWVRTTLDADGAIGRDASAMERITGVDPTILCKSQRSVQ